MGETTENFFQDLDLFSEQPVFVPAANSHLEPQPHGGALKRYIPLIDEEDDLRPHHEVVPVDLWPAKLPAELAMCASLEEQAVVVDKFGLSPEEFERICRMPQFRRAVNEAAVMIRETGYTFKMKCRGIAEDFLGDLDFSLHDRTVGLSTKLDIFKTLTRLGDLEPAKQKTEAGTNVPTVNIQINV